MRPNRLIRVCKQAFYATAASIDPGQFPSAAASVHRASETNCAVFGSSEAGESGFVGAVDGAASSHNCGKGAGVELVRSAAAYRRQHDRIVAVQRLERAKGSSLGRTLRALVKVTISRSHCCHLARIARVVSPLVW